jgi:hypothetical protein
LGVFVGALIGFALAALAVAASDVDGDKHEQDPI